MRYNHDSNSHLGQTLFASLLAGKVEKDMQEEPNLPEWTVLLIGGSSAVGKTIAAKALAQHFQVSLLLVDDIRLALQQVTLPNQQPILDSVTQFSRCGHGRVWRHHE
jgi:hypothetical protein